MSMAKTLDGHINDVFIPTVAESPRDTEISWEVQKPLADRGYRPGLMLVIRKTNPDQKPRVFDTENVKKQYDNLAKHSEVYGNAPIITMLSNLPIEHIDFLHNVEEAKYHVCQGIEFAKNLPIGARKILTFHLNTLITPEEFKSRSQEEWYRTFDSIIRPRLNFIGGQGKDNNVEVLVESVPVPEFGDIPGTDERMYRGVKWRELRNPFYMLGNNHVWNTVKRSGLGVCLDVCHNRTIYLEVSHEVQEVLFKDDAHFIKKEYTIDELQYMDCMSRRLLGDVMELHPRTDLVHLNDGKGRYTKEGAVFYEGIALGEGDIEGLKYMINTMNQRKIPFVIEVNETDFDNRPNTKKSIEYILNTKPEDF